MDLSIYLSEIHEIPQKSKDLPWISPQILKNIEDIEKPWNLETNLTKQSWMNGINTGNAYVGNSK